MRRSPLAFFLSLAGFLITLAIFSLLLRSDAFARFAILRLLLIGAGLVFFGDWTLRLILASRLVPAPVRDRLLCVQRSVTRFVRWLVFSPRMGLVFASIVFACAALFSVWYASLGLFPAFPKLDNLYVDQAQAFLSGQMALLETPSADLLALADPYSFEQREGIPYLWDASLYNGKYYLYWGPVPALILAGIMRVAGGPVPASILVLLSVLTILAILFVLLWSVSLRCYPRIPSFSTGLFLIAACVNLPYLFLLGRGRAYETSIITGQVFLMIGILGFFYFLQSNRPAWLLLAGLGWGLAVSCRYNLAVSVAVFVAVALWILWRPSAGWKPAVQKAIFLVAPLVVCALGLGLYNWLRFDNPLETGLKYQLTIPVYHNQHFSTEYLRTSCYLNIFYPYRQQDAFPLIRSIAVVPGDFPAWVGHHPGKRNDETVFAMNLLPVFWLILPLQGVVRVGLRWQSSKQPKPAHAPQLHGWAEFSYAIAAAGFLQFAVLLFYYYASVRFMADYFLLWLLTTIFMLWSVDSKIEHIVWLRVALWTVAILAVISTALLGFLAGFDNPPRVFEIYNPALEAQIASSWDALYHSSGILGKALRYLMLLFL